jgi:hypothetical protein
VIFGRSPKSSFGEAQVLETELRKLLTGTKVETLDTDKEYPSHHRASARPYHLFDKTSVDNALCMVI